MGRNKVREYFSIIEPLVNYLIKNKEQHAVISNHLATSAAALFLWEELTGKFKNSYKNVLEIIYNNQSQEGWYKSMRVLIWLSNTLRKFLKHDLYQN